MLKKGKKMIKINGCMHLLLNTKKKKSKYNENKNFKTKESLLTIRFYARFQEIQQYILKNKKQ